MAGCCEGAAEDAKLTHHEPHKFAEWQKGGPSLLFLLYRLVMFGYFATVMVYYIATYQYGAKWLIFLTNWSLTVIVVCSTLQVINAATHYGGSMSGPKKYSDMPVLYKIQWALFSILCAVSPVVTIMYWTAVWKPDWGIKFVNFSTHAVNTMYLLIDIFIVATPLRLAHIYFPICYGLTYGIFTIIYWAAGGTGDENPYIYAVLDYSKDKTTAFIYLGVVLVALPTMYIIMYCLYRLRVFLYDSCCPSQSKEPTETTKLTEG